MATSPRSTPFLSPIPPAGAAVSSRDEASDETQRTRVEAVRRRLDLSGSGSPQAQWDALNQSVSADQIGNAATPLSGPSQAQRRNISQVLASARAQVSAAAATRQLGPPQAQAENPRRRLDFAHSAEASATPPAQVVSRAQSLAPASRSVVLVGQEGGRVFSIPLQQRPVRAVYGQENPNGVSGPAPSIFHSAPKPSLDKARIRALIDVKLLEQNPLFIIKYNLLIAHNSTQSPFEDLVAYANGTEADCRSVEDLKLWKNLRAEILNSLVKSRLEWLANRTAPARDP